MKKVILSLLLASLAHAEIKDMMVLGRDANIIGVSVEDNVIRERTIKNLIVNLQFSNECIANASVPVAKVTTDAFRKPVSIRVNIAANAVVCPMVYRPTTVSYRIKVLDLEDGSKISFDKGLISFE